MSRSIRPARVLPLLAFAAFSALLGAAAPAPFPIGKEKEREPEEPNVEVRFTDGSSMRLRILETDLPLKTPYGKLTIPVDKIQEVDCATRLPGALAKRIKAAVAKLDAEEQRERDDAQGELARYGVKAYAALLEAEKSDKAEVRKRARDLLEKIRDQVSSEDLEARPSDVVQTADSSRVVGRLEVETLKAETSQFGEVRLRLSDVRSIRSLTFAPPEKKIDALLDPGYLNQYNAQVGQTFVFNVVGAVNGTVYGTDTYTTDSLLAAAAVHAGVVKPGQKGVVKVKILGQVGAFVGSTRNGVTSHNYQAYPGYEIIKKK